MPWNSKRTSASLHPPRFANSTEHTRHDGGRTIKPLELPWLLLSWIVTGLTAACILTVDCSAAPTICDMLLRTPIHRHQALTGRVLDTHGRNVRFDHIESHG